MNIRTGIGIDAHRFCAERPLILGGANIPSEKGLEGHSDADVLIHAVMDALLGAAGLGDIGMHFPPSDPAYKNISSLDLLKKVDHLLNVNLWKVVNIDAVIIAQAPRVGPYRNDMISNIRKCLTGDPDVNVKATTTEKMGFAGRGEGIVSLCTVLINRSE